MVILIQLLILALVIWMVFWILGQLPIPEPAMTIAKVILGVLFLIVLLNMVFGFYPMPKMVL